MLFLLPLILAAQPPLSTEADVVKAVLREHPEVAAATERVAMARANADAALAYTDPLFAVEYGNMPISKPLLGAHPMAGLQFRLTQKIPFPGKNAARAEAIALGADAEASMADEVRGRLVAQTRSRIAKLRWARALAALTKKNQASLSRLLAVVSDRYELGKAEQSDVLRLRVLRGKLVQQEQDAAEQAAALVAELNAMAGRPIDAPIELGSTNVLPSSKDGELARPLLAVFAGRAKAATADARAVAMDALPDVTTWVGYRVRLPSGPDVGENFVTVGAAIPLPWLWGQRRWRNKERASLAKAKSLGARREATLRALRTKVAGAKVRLARAVARAKAHETELIPQAEQTRQATLSSYQLGRANFADLYQAELDVITLERTAADARAEAVLAAIEIDLQQGQNL